MLRRALIVLLLIISPYCLADARGHVCEQRHCSVIVDAGSSGSRVHLYAFDLNEHNEPIHIEEVFVNKVTPGFASLPAQAEQVNNYLSGLLSPVPAQNLPVYFYATAGMRLLSEQQQQALYSKLIHWFSENPQWTLMEAKTITGTDEGVLGWLATNHELGLMDNEGRSQVGFIEIGGASVQIVFPIQDDYQIDKQDLVTVIVHNRPVLLFSHSFWGLGATEITKKFKHVSACFPTGYLLPDQSVAQGDGYACGEQLGEVINGHNEISDVVKTAQKNNSTPQWYTVGAVSALITKLSNQFPNGQFTANSLLNTVDSNYCQANWQDQQQAYPGDGYLSQNCILGAFFNKLTTNGMGLQPDQTIQSLPANLHGDWTLGVVIQQTNQYN